MKRSYLVLPFCCAASLAQAAEPPVQQYRYGLPLDIARVISIETPYDPYVCRIVDARMTYRRRNQGRHLSQTIRRLSPEDLMRSLPVPTGTWGTGVDGTPSLPCRLH
ncbi:DUF2790 domain-containing protein [Azotobacter chroococcum]|nr:DUF2790 domain-containing protein [Azotobacter chroococcum]